MILSQAITWPCCAHNLTRLRGAYLLRVLQSKGLAYQFHIEAKGVTRYGLSHAGIKSVRLPLPPLPEQAAIVRFLDHADRRTRRYIRAKERLIGTVNRTERETSLMSEYRTRLITDVVTGKLDVREAAAALLEVDPLAAEDGPNDTIDTGTEQNFDKLDTALEGSGS